MDYLHLLQRLRDMPPMTRWGILERLYGHMPFLAPLPPANANQAANEVVVPHNLGDGQAATDVHQAANGVVELPDPSPLNSLSIDDPQGASQEVDPLGLGSVQPSINAHQAANVVEQGLDPAGAPPPTGPLILDGAHDQPSQKDISPANGATINFKRLSALIIGIDQYQSSTKPIGALYGAVADAEAVGEFLQKHGVPEENIEFLKNDKATASAIKDKILAFSTNNKIHKDDPILIYYAGHGSEADAPKNWNIYNPAGPSKDSEEKVQLLIPYDFNSAIKGSSEGQGIVDRTLSSLLRKVANAKGNNILVVLDCCHSQSGSRGRLEITDFTYRFHMLPKGYQVYEDSGAEDSDGEDSDTGLVFSKSTQLRDAVVPERLVNAEMRSHVLLAACQKDQGAAERNGRGVFTRILLEHLSGTNIESMSYMEAILTLPTLPSPDQIPHCEGVHKDRLFFRSTVPSREMVLPIKSRPNGIPYIDLGEASNINAATEFSIYPDRESVMALATYKAKDLTAYSANLEYHSGKTVADFTTKHYYARRGRRDPSVTVYVPETLAEMLKLDSGGRSAHESLFDAHFVHDVAQCDISLSLEDDQLRFFFHDELSKKHMITSTSQAPVSSDKDSEIIRFLSSACHFYSRLRSQSGPRSEIPSSGNAIVVSYTQAQALAEKVQVECHEVKTKLGDDLDFYTSPVNDINFYQDGEIHVRARKQTDETVAQYGFKITNLMGFSVYAGIFCFNPKTLSINEWHTPTSSKIPCMKATKGSVEIGRGPAIHTPYEFTLADGENREVSFLKIFLSTKYVNLSTVAQVSPFDMGGQQRGDKVVQINHLDFWASRIIPIIQTAV